MKQWIRSVVVPAVVIAGAAAALTAAGLGCEETPAVPQAVLEEANKQAEPQGAKRPTTQDLLSGRRTRSALIPLPLTMEIPPGWGKPKDLETTPENLLHGYTPNGDVQIQVASRPAMTQVQLDRLLEGAKKEMEKNPSIKVELRQTGTLNVLVRQTVGKPKELISYTLSNNEMLPHSRIESPFGWTHSILVPNEGAYQVYELNFLGLTKSQYDKDKEFLESILSTIQYAGDGGGVAPASPAAPPTSNPPTSNPPMPTPAAPLSPAAPGSSNSP